MKAFTTPTVAKIVNRIPKGANMSKVSMPGMPRLSSQNLNNKIARKLEAVDAINLALGDMSYPKSSANPTEKTGAADIIKSVSCSASRSNTTERGMKPKDRRGISTRMLMYIARPPTLGTKPLCALWTAASSNSPRRENP